MRAVLDDYTTSPLSEREKALFAFLDRVNGESSAIRRDDVDRLKGLGWSEEAIYDAVTVCALFNFYNRWIDATGVHDMPPEAYEMSGIRLRDLGYHKKPT